MCAREHDFGRLYQVLGDRAAQDTIRAGSKDETHCPYLKAKPDACMSLPEDYAEGMAGQTCPNNPFEQDEPKKLIEQLNEASDILNECDYVRQKMDLGMLPRTTDEIDPAEYLIASIVHDHVRAQEREFEMKVRGL